jgi:hypothetical protein
MERHVTARWKHCLVLSPDLYLRQRNFSFFSIRQQVLYRPSFPQEAELSPDEKLSSFCHVTIIAARDEHEQRQYGGALVISPKPQKTTSLHIPSPNGIILSNFLCFQKIIIIT